MRATVYHKTILDVGCPEMLIQCHFPRVDRRSGCCVVAPKASGSREPERTCGVTRQQFFSELTERQQFRTHGKAAVLFRTHGKAAAQ